MGVIHAKTVAGLIFLLTGVLLAGADSTRLDSLVTNSPFGSTAGTAASPQGESAVEFRGVFVDQGETFFSIYDTAARRAMWVGMKEPGNPYAVKSYDEARGTVIVEFQGRTLTVELKQAKVVALPAGSSGTSAASPNPGAPAVATVTTTDEATRLAQVAEEIRRRRAIRAQAMQPSAPPPGGTRP